MHFIHASLEILELNISFYGLLCHLRLPAKIACQPQTSASQNNQVVILLFSNLNDDVRDDTKLNSRLSARTPGSQIDLYMFDDRIEIRNPGSIGEVLTAEDPQQTGKRWLRNPNKAGFLLGLRYIEKAGTDIARMFRALRENGSPEPTFLVETNSVKVIMRVHNIQNFDFSSGENRELLRYHGQFQITK